jgi:hypothetical protein
VQLFGCQPALDRQRGGGISVRYQADDTASRIALGRQLPTLGFGLAAGVPTSRSEYGGEIVGRQKAVLAPCFFERGLQAVEKSCSARLVGHKRTKAPA